MAGEFGLGYALAIGVGRYKHLSPLARSSTDARDVANLLVDQCGYPHAQVATLIDQKATKSAINEKLEWLARRATQDATVVIFFSGHGAQRLGGFEPGEYLCPVDADLYNPATSAISSEEFSAALRAAPAQKVVVFLDACHSGGVGDVRDAAQVKAGLSMDAYNRLASGEGRVILASCKPDQVSWELGSMRNGLFTHYLLKGLRGGAAGSEGNVGIFDLAKYTMNNVNDRARQEGFEQSPWFKGATEDFVVAVKENFDMEEAIDLEVNMPGIPGDLRNRLRETLRRCSAFKSNSALRSVFSDARINLWSGEVVEASSELERINQALTLLYEKETIDDENGLILFLEVLSESLPARDKVRKELRDLIEELRRYLGKSPSPPLEPRPLQDWSRFADELLEILYRIPAMEDYDNRSELLNGLPPGPSGFIKRLRAKNADLRSIVNGAKGMGWLINARYTGLHALDIVARNALDFVKGLTMEEELRDLLAGVDRVKRG